MTTHSLVPALDKKDTTERLVQYSRFNGMIPRLYVSPWKTDMKNRELLLDNAEPGLVPNYAHDEPLNWEKREQMSYNVELRPNVDMKYQLPARCRLLGPLFHHHDGRHFSSCLYYTDGPDPRWPNNQRAFDMPAIMRVPATCSDEHYRWFRK